MATKTDPILAQKYPGITPLEAFKLLRRLDTWAGLAGKENSQPHLDIRDALARHVSAKLERRR